MNYLIIGASGFLGKNLVSKIDQSKHNIKLFDQAIDTNLFKKETNGMYFEYVEGNFSPNYDFEKLTFGIDVVYHLISTTIPSSDKPLADELTENVISSIKLLDACKKNRVKKIIFLSSGGTVYGESTGIPFKETASTNPICSYGIQKLAIEKYIQLYHHLHNLDYRIIRLSNPYGPGQNPHKNQGIIAKFIYHLSNDIPIQVYGEGDIVRDYIYIEDAIQGILDIESYQGKDKIFNLGVGQGQTINQVIKTIEKVMNKKFVVQHKRNRSIDVPYNVLDISKFSKISSKEDFISLEQGITKFCEYFSKESKE